MKSKIVDNRNHIKRLSYNDTEKYLSELHGAPYIKYREEFENARKNHIRTEKPLQITLQLSSFCNLNCIMCAWRSRKGAFNKEHMSLEMVDDIAKQIKDMKLPSIRIGAFTEPTVHPHFSEIMKKLADTRPVDFWLTTNGLLLNEEIAEMLVDIELTLLHVSIDAATPETYKTIRGGNLEIVEKNIMKLLEIRKAKNSVLPFLRVTFIESEENKHEVEMFKKKWENYADIVDLQKYIDLSSLKKDSTGSPKVKKEAESNHDGEEFECNHPYFQLVIMYDGQILPCSFFMYETLNPVYMSDYSLLDYWNSPELLGFFETIKTKQYIDCCKRCVASVES